MNDLFQRPPGFVYRKKTNDAEVRSASRSHGQRPASSLCCEGLPLEKLATRFGTPLYVYSATVIRERVAAFERAFRSIDHSICYSVKANSNLSILRLLAKLGCGFDVVSAGELARVQKASPRSVREIVFSGVGKTSDEITAAINAGILIFNVESASELEVLASCTAKLRKRARVALRVNPDVPADTHPYISTGLQKHKFGLPLTDAPALYAKAAQSKYLEVAGVSVHIGSQITDHSPFAAAMQRVADLVRQLRRDDGHQIRFVDAGGGLGINYREGTDNFGDCVSAYAQAVSAPLRGLGVKLLLEPGRSIVGPAGILLTRVVYRKANGNKKFVIVDAAMNDLIRPSLYQAEHQIVPVRANSGDSEVVDVVGPVCESGDFFARDRSLPSVNEGDLLAILDAGAYGMALASNYNTRPRPAEVLVNRRTAKLIRKREGFADLMRPEIN